jgi:hypothetical protein
MDRHRREILNTVRAEGFEVMDLREAGSGHVKMRLRHGNRTYLTVASKQFGDPHARRNFIAQLRRFARGDVKCVSRSN